VAGGNLALSAAYGEVTIAAVGTATSVCDDRVVGFGHPATFQGKLAAGLHPAEALYVQFLSDANSIGPSVEEVASRQQEQRDPKKPSEACICGLARDAQTLEKAQDILANTSWETSVPAARDKRQELCTLLDLKMQKKEPAEAGATQQPRPKATTDELDSYEYLVRTAGY
jgi:hypothetical protein